MTVANTAPNYTDAMTAELVSAYVANPTAETIEAFAAKFGKTIKSIVAKLVNEKVYVAKATGSGAKRETKASMIAEITKALCLPADALVSLEKATTEDLKALRGAVAWLATK